MPARERFLRAGGQAAPARPENLRGRGRPFLVRRSAQRSPLTGSGTTARGAVMHKLFLAVMVSCILLLFTAAGLFMTLTNTTAVQKTTSGMIRQQRR